ncbi:poly(rC)-binding protein 2-like [Xenia sp. Carnegie-2017]|uniref:poly(rC)-binding protein 2-like n=1 Tax=Xenia sp. Carnegie-2017 TaxID=2897299 RepID=UPI001F04DABA|nr:poly(rC)-binding protein 2-like [Xenia sp. Carnegie-2017]
MSNRRKKARMMSESDFDDDIVTLRFIMNGKEAGLLIGKGGETIKNLRKSSDAIINISDNTSRERLVSLTGPVNSVIHAFKLIIERFEEDYYSRSSPEDMVFQLLVPSAQCGSLIGRSGSTIKYIREKSGAHIMIDSDPMPQSSERMVHISGSASSVIGCMKSICDTMVQNPVSCHIDPYYPENSPMNKKSNRPVRNHRYDRDSYERRDQGRPLLRSPLPRRRKRSDDFLDEFMTETMSIPSQFAGSLIGRRGAKINEIRTKSEASIKIADAREGSSERIVTISGNPEAVGMAQFLIKSRVKFEEKKAKNENALS